MLGGVTPVEELDFELDGQVDATHCPRHVANAGDMNGDGFADIVVGLPNSTAGDTALLFFGGSAIDGTTDLEFLGTSGVREFGYSVAGAGDINGDGYADVLVGAADLGGSGSVPGAVDIFFGGDAPGPAAKVALVSPPDDDSFGRSVALISDLNGDGRADSLVGSPGYDSSGLAGAGRVAVYLGREDPISDFDFVYETLDGRAHHLGYSVEAAGDVNGDGYADAIVGEPSQGSGRDTGQAYLYLGGPIPNTDPVLAFNGESLGDGFGMSVW